MNEEFYSIGRGSLNINGKFYYGLDYQITDFMRSLEEENQKLKEQINKAKEYIEPKLNMKNKDGVSFSLFKRSHVEKILEILDNKGE